MLCRLIGRTVQLNGRRCFSLTPVKCAGEWPPDRPRQERTFVMLKPDGVQRCLAGPIVGKIEDKGFKLVAMKMMHAPLSICEEHYKEHKGKKFFPLLIKYIRSGPVLPMVFEGDRSVEGLRNLIGDKDPLVASPGTIRGNWGITKARNVIHGSDSVESAEREINLWFKPEEIVEWTRWNHEWLYEYDE